MSLTIADVASLLGNLFVVYVFGDIYLAGAFLVVYILCLAMVLRIGGDAIAAVFAFLAFLASSYVFGNIITPILVIVLGSIIYLGLTKLKSR